MVVLNPKMSFIKVGGRPGCLKLDHESHQFTRFTFAIKCTRTNELLVTRGQMNNEGKSFHNDAHCDQAYSCSSSSRYRDM